jgi:hypothetical protein
MHTDLRAAVVGAWYWGTNLIRVLQKVAGLHLTTVCDPRPEIQHEIKEPVASCVELSEAYASMSRARFLSQR